MKPATCPLAYITLLCGHRVMVARKDDLGGTLRIELLLNLDDLYGTVTEHGTMYCRTKEELLKRLRFVFDVAEIKILHTTLVK